MEVPSRQLISSEMKAMYEIVDNLLNKKIVKTFGFTEVESNDGSKFSIADMTYKDNTYYMVLVEEGEEETGIFIRSALVPELEIILPLPSVIRVNDPLYDDLL